MGIVTYAQNFEDVLLWRALGDVAMGFYIDVGAWDPDVHSVTRAFSERGWHGINVEPITGYHQRLVARRPRDINLQVCLGAEPGDTTIREVAGTGLSTTVAAYAEEHGSAGFEVTEHHIRVTTLAALCEQHGTATIHFLKIDCEGAERAVLEGADWQRYRPWIVIVEATVPGTTRPAYAEWEPILTDAGYRFSWFDGLNRFYIAEEHFARLHERLALPPNVFDEFRLPHAENAEPIEASEDPLVSAIPLELDVEQRIDLAARCRDCDYLPKVPEAGRVIQEADGTRVQIMHNGLRVIADGYCGAWMTRLIERCRGHHEPQEERVFSALSAALNYDATMVELGSNWAFYSAWFLKEGAQRRAVLLEPDAANREVGRRNLELNGLRATIVAGFAGAEPSAEIAFKTERSGAEMLRCYSVPELLRENAIDTLDLLHCDTQGAELGVLQGCAPLFRSGRIRWLFVSTHVHQISGDVLTHQRCLALLRAEGAAIEIEHNPYESFSGDGLIVARFGPPPAGWQVPAISFARQSESLFRDPIYELADVTPLARSAVGLAADVVRGAYQAILLREPEAAGLEAHTQQLLTSGNAHQLLASLLGSAEAASKRDLFLAEHGVQSSVPLVPASSAGDAHFGCDRVNLVLRHDGPLGSAGDRLSMPNDRVLLPAVLGSSGWNIGDLDFLRQRLDPEREYTLIDIGANVGLFSRQVLNAFPCVTHCLCVEPDPSNYDALTENMARFGPERTCLFNLGLGTENARVPFFRDTENSGNYSCHPDAMRGRPFETATVQLCEAGQWLSQAQSASGPLIWKSDTQGSDELIVAAAPEQLWRRVEVAIVELWRIDKGKNNVDAFLDRVADMPVRMIGHREVSIDDVRRYIAGKDFAHEDLLLWR